MKSTKTTQIQIRIAPAEKRLWETCARQAGVTLASWIRNQCNQKKEKS